MRRQPVVRIARALGVSTDYLLGGDDGAGTNQLEEADRLRERIRVASLRLDQRALKFADEMISALIEHERGRPRRGKA